MIFPAPTRRAAWIVLSPTPPQPKTATLAPGGTLARLKAGPVLLEAWGAIEHEPPRLVPERAHRRLAADAVPAPAARRDVARADVVARRHGLDPRPDLLDHARGLVTEHDGQGMGRVTRDHVQVAVADAVGRPPHLHLVGPGLE